jgi:formate C-acetyltransferase
VLNIKKAILDAPRALDVEVSKLKTEYYKTNGWDKPVAIHRSERLRHVLAHKTVKVYPGELLVGNFTSKRVAGNVWEEQYGWLMALTMYQINRQKPVPFEINAKERWTFYLNIFPYWLRKSIVSRFAELPKLDEFTKILGRVGELNSGFNNNLAAIAHFVPNYDRLIELGITGLKAEVEKAAKEYPENNQDFYKGALLGLEAAEMFAQRYANELSAMAAREKDANRKAELELMAQNCRNVPKNPAKTFHEALQSIMLFHIILCTEQYENAISFGRLDQILYPLYKADVEAGRITYDQAKELLCLFVLKMDECILVNDGDGILRVGQLFETLSTDQAVTFGGIGKDGKDAVNDITYMLIDSCELQPLAINMCARIHKDNPPEYFDRLAEIYINGCPMPEMFSDAEYIPSILQHYDTPVEQARNYSVIGCVEPNASDDHFGNTDSANVNVTLPLLQALKGHEHDLWNFPVNERLEKLITRVIEFYSRKNSLLYKVKDGKVAKSLVQSREKYLERLKAERGLFEYNPPENMDELLTRYQARLNFLTQSILTDQQRLEKVLRENFTAPVASSLYKGCVRRGLDAYEGGTDFRTAGIQGVGITDAADSLYAVDELVFKQKKYTMKEILTAIDANFEGEQNQKIHEDLLAVPKFGDNTSDETSKWVNKVLDMYNKALDSIPYAVRDGKYTAGYYALNTNDKYGAKTQALPSGRKKGVSLANSVGPHYGAAQTDLLSALNDVDKIDFQSYAVNGTTLTVTLDAALFPGKQGVRNLSSIIKTYLTEGGMQFQPNVVSRDLFLKAYYNPEEYKYLMVRIAGYCSYFQELSDELKWIIINRTCYS